MLLEVKKKFSFSNSPGKMVLSDRDAHIWKATTNTTNRDYHNLLKTLSNEEYERSKRFHFEKDRRQYVVAHGLLRVILSCYTDHTPSEICFTHSKHGKPSLSNQSDVQFNISHSGEMVLLGFSSGREIGVDIEEIRSYKNAQEIVYRYFSPYEKKVFQHVPDQLKETAFFLGSILRFLPSRRFCSNPRYPDRQI